MITFAGIKNAMVRGARLAIPDNAGYVNGTADGGLRNGSSIRFARLLFVPALTLLVIIMAKLAIKAVCTTPSRKETTPFAHAFVMKFRTD